VRSCPALHTLEWDFLAGVYFGILSRHMWSNGGLGGNSLRSSIPFMVEVVLGDVCDHEARRCCPRRRPEHLRPSNCREGHFLAPLAPVGRALYGQECPGMIQIFCSGRRTLDAMRGPRPPGTLVFWGSAPTIARGKAKFYFAATAVKP